MCEFLLLLWSQVLDEWQLSLFSLVFRGWLKSQGMQVISHVHLDIPIYCREHNPIKPKFEIILSLENTRDTSLKNILARTVDLQKFCETGDQWACHLITPQAAKASACPGSSGVTGEVLLCFVPHCYRQKRAGQRSCTPWEDTQGKSEVRHLDTS